MSQDQVLGHQSISTLDSGYNAQYSIIQSILSGIHTAILAQVIKVTNDGGVSPVGYVDLQPLVNQVSGAGYAVAQGIIHNVPYFRLQGGSSAIIIDPKIGDNGLAVFCERDISSVVKNVAQSNPGSARQYDISDGVFFPCFLGAAPAQYIQFDDSAITIFSPGNISIQASGSVSVTAGTTASVTAGSSITMTAPDIVLVGNTAVTGNFSFSGTGMNDGTDIGATHEHDVVGVQPGGATITTTPPVV